MKRMAIFGLVVAAGLAAGLCRADGFDDDYAKARKLLDGGDSDEAAKVYVPLKQRLEAALAKTPDDAHLNYVYGRVCMDGGDDAGATAALDKALAKEPKNVDCLMQRALLLEYQEKPAEAVALYKRAAEADPKRAESWTQLARAQQAIGQFTVARGSLGKAIALEPKQARFVGMLGEVYAAEGKAAEALKTYQQAVTLDPKYARGHANIGQLQQNAGRFAESLAAYEQALKLNAEDWRSWAKEVQLYAALKKPKERDAAREKILALWKAGKIDEPMYCREQYTQGADKLMVFEYFGLRGERAVRYSFNVLAADGKPVKRISLGSYEQTTAIARETGEIKKDERMYHVDEYTPLGHATLAMLKKEPTYEDVRQIVNDRLAGKGKVLSSTSRPAGGEK